MIGDPLEQLFRVHPSVLQVFVQTRRDHALEKPARRVGVGGGGWTGGKEGMRVQDRGYDVRSVMVSLSVGVSGLPIHPTPTPIPEAQNYPTRKMFHTTEHGGTNHPISSTLPSHLLYPISSPTPHRPGPNPLGQPTISPTSAPPRAPTLSRTRTLRTAGNPWLRQNEWRSASRPSSVSNRLNSSPSSVARLTCLRVIV